MRRKLVVGNWKMHGSRAANAQLLAGLKEAGPWNADVAVCVPFPYIAETALALTGTTIVYGAQDCSAHEQGAYTGEVSSAMLHDIGCRYAIVGDSERRAYHAESDQLVADKAKAALAHGVTPIVCVGETLQERESEKLFEVVKRQTQDGLDGLTTSDMERIIIAYEPVWAIGTGQTATPEQAQEMHGFIRQILAETHGEDIASKVRILYGGSVKPENIRVLMNQNDIDGALVGGASLEAESFAKIVNYNG